MNDVSDVALRLAIVFVVFLVAPSSWARPSTR